MRLAPIPMYYFSDLEKTLHFAGESSRTTHGAQECIESCQLFAEMLFHAFSGLSKDEILLNTTIRISSSRIQGIANGNYCQKSIDQIRGTGYVVESLEGGAAVGAAQVEDLVVEL